MKNIADFDLDSGRELPKSVTEYILGSFVRIKLLVLQNSVDWYILAGERFVDWGFHKNEASPEQTFKMAKSKAIEEARKFLDGVIESLNKL